MNNTASYKLSLHLRLSWFAVLQEDWTFAQVWYLPGSHELSNDILPVRCRSSTDMVIISPELRLLTNLSSLMTSKMNLKLLTALEIGLSMEESV